MGYIALTQLQTFLRGRGIAPGVVSEVTGIGGQHSSDPKRLRDLIKGSHEPWFGEAMKIYRLFGNLPNMLQLTGATMEAAVAAAGPAGDDDWPSWISGEDQSLSLAIRITKRLGLDDPIQLTEHGTAWRLVKHVLISNERNAAHGECPWCLTAYPNHRELCLAAAIMRPGLPAGSRIAIFRPGYQGRGGRAQTSHILEYLRLAGSTLRARDNGTSETARGTKVTQREIAEVLEYDMFHYARIERKEMPLPLKKAEVLARFYGIDVDDLYRRPTEFNPAPTLTRAPSMRYVPKEVRRAAATT